MLDYFPGGALNLHIVNNKKLKRNKVFLQRFMAWMMLNVEFLHSQFITHNDIHGLNIVFDKDGIPKLIDFGRAKFFDYDRQDNILKYENFVKHESKNDWALLRAVFTELIDDNLEDIEQAVDVVDRMDDMSDESFISSRHIKIIKILLLNGYMR